MTDRKTVNRARVACGAVWPASLIALAAALCACDDGPPAGVIPPPSANTAPPVAKTFSYDHKVMPKITSPRWAVAILRFSDVGTAPTIAAPPPDTVIIKVDPNSPPMDRPQMNKRAREILKHTLVQTKAFTVCDRERIGELIREINLGQTDVVDPNTSPPMGELISVRYFIEGSVGLNEDRTLKGAIPNETDLRELENPGGLENIFDPSRGGTRNRATVFREIRERRMREAARRTFAISCFLSVYEVHSGAVVATTMGLGVNGQEAITDAVDELVLTLSRLRAEPRLAAVIKNRVYLDVGVSEVKTGQTFDIIAQGTAIRDRSGLVIGYEEAVVGQIQVDDVKELMSTAHILRGDPLKFARGQLCRPAKE